ncbi:hypothetical protein [Pseudooceanicola sp. HF7]|uniref:hypothetical protein n=1 Tax=Pseudooceanicola sp. HF7 TaxID=2721560 RepID=UPI00142FE533|nr:hypothetical protein [Pseudooceanicola sp. HF7]NIZ11177.1 hypothetical protein [Pseudooceanicola sp. HF7]
MRPDLALRFTEHALSLQRRADGVWADVGRARFEDDNFAAQVASILARAEAELGQPVRSQIVLPEDQVRYLTIAVPQDLPHGEEAPLVAAALEGVTPYAVADLRFDWHRTGAELQIAAVARETLEEADRFATRWGFNPVAYVAAPTDPAVFAKEPYFGPEERPADPAPVAAPNAEPVAAPAAPAEPPKPLTAPEVAQLARPLGETPAPVAAPEPVRTADIAQPAEPPADLSAEAPASVTPVEVSPPPAPQPPAPKPPAGSMQTAPPPVAPAPDQAAQTEAERLTVFGTRDEPKRSAKGKLMLAGAALVLLAGAGTWAFLMGPLSGSMEPPEQIALNEPESAAPDDATNGPLIGTSPEEMTGAAQQPDSLPAPRSGADNRPAAAAPQALAPSDAGAPPNQPESVPVAAPVPRSAPATPSEAAARYAATGIWQRAPLASVAPPGSVLAPIEVALASPVEGLPPVFETMPQPVLPPVPDPAFSEPPLPPAPDARFELDDRGLVVATPEGAMTPAGHLVYSGPPDVVPPERPGTDPAQEAPAEEAAGPETPGADTAATEASEAETPVEAPEPAQTAEDADSETQPSPLAEELAGLVRPRPRPAGIEDTGTASSDAEDLADGEPEATEDDEELAVPRIFSLRPHARPKGFAEQVAAARAAAPAVEPSQTTSPPAPSQSGVTRLATAKRAINLNDLNLIGVMGSSGNRSALVRLPNGRIVKVGVGDRLDGGRVAAISEDALRYVKSNRNLLLEMP